MQPAAKITTLFAVAALLAGCTSGDPDDDVAPGGSATSTPPATVQLAQSEGPNDGVPTDGVTVTGTGESRVTPDVLQAVLGAEVTADTVEDALSEANQAAQDAIGALRDAGVDDADIQTRDLTVREQRSEPRPPPEGEAPERPEPSGYVARNLVEVRIGAIDDAGGVLQAALAAAGDAARLEEVRFTLSEEPTSAQASAREAAFEAARDGAETYAQLAGRSLGALVSLREHGGGGPPRAAEAADAAIPIEPGQQAVTVTVTATWSLEE